MADFLFSDGRSRTLTEKFARVNWTLLLAIAALVAIGTVSLYSTADGSFHPWAEAHALRFIVCAGVAITIALIGPQVWMSLAAPIYIIALIALALVPWFGAEAMGAKRWIGVGGLKFQPSEIMKIGLLLALASYYQWLGSDRVSRPRYVAFALLMIAVPVVLTLRQPDLGSAVLFGVVGMAVLFAAGVSIWYFLIGGGGVLALVPLIWANLHDYQRQRVETFLNPEADPLGAGYHIIQSKIAFGAGGLSGRGFMRGTQSQLDFLPEKHTDFIFTMIGEEWGFIGCALILMLFALILLNLLWLGLRAKSSYARLISFGAGMVIFTYMFINMAMVTGLVPVVGVPLPFVSYGGSSMVTLMVCIGLAMSAHVHENERLDRNRKYIDW